MKKTRIKKLKIHLIRMSQRIFVREILKNILSGSEISASSFLFIFITITYPDHTNQKSITRLHNRPENIKITFIHSCLHP